MQSPQPPAEDRQLVDGRYPVGESFRLPFHLSLEEIERYAALTEDSNPVHLDDEAARAAGFSGRLAHGMLSGAIFSRIFGMHYPGPGTIYLGQSLRFRAPVYPGEPLVAEVVVSERRRNRATLTTTVHHADGTLLVEGEAQVILPPPPAPSPPPA
jgi:3-hydroxybutyryl-CoA dehydratase